MSPASNRDTVAAMLTLFYHYARECSEDESQRGMDTMPSCFNMKVALAAVRPCLRRVHASTRVLARRSSV